jgi:hypothetical protein
MGMDREAAIDAMLAKEALRDLAMRYCRAIDRRDPVLLASVYHGDAIDDHGTVFCDTAARFVAQQADVMAPFALTAHYVCNTSYRTDGDRADGELYFIAYHRTTGPDPDHIMVSGRYLDNYERRDGEWRIAHRRLVWDSVVTLNAAPADMEMLAGLGAVGAADTDRSYEALPLMARGQ